MRVKNTPDFVIGGLFNRRVRDSTCVQPRLQLLALKQTNTQTRMGGLSVEGPAFSFHCRQRETENRIGCWGREALMQWRGGGQPEESDRVLG